MSSPRTASERPRRREAIPHESAALHVTGLALYTDDLVGRTPDVPARLPRAGAARPRPGDAARPEPGARRARRGPGAHRRRRARASTTPASSTTNRCSPPRSATSGTPSAGCSARRSRPPGSAPRPSRWRYEPLPAARHGARSHRGGELPGRPAAPGARRRRGRLGRAAHVFRASSSSPGRSTSTSRPTAALAHVDENGQVFVQCSTQHPSETQEIVAHVLGLRSHDVTVQCLRMGGGFGGKEMQPHGYAAIAALGATLTGRPVRLRLNRTQDMTMTGKRHGFHAEWRVGFDDDGRLQALDATLTSDGGWSLDLSEPVLARALCHIDNAYWIPNVGVNGRIAQDQQDVADRVPRVRRAAGDARHRGHPRPVRARCSGSTPPSCAGATSTAGPVHALRAAGAAPGAARSPPGTRSPTRRRRPAAGGDRRVQRGARAHQAGPGDDPGEVRDLLQPHRVQPGRRAGARLQGRLGADQPRRHRDGPGPAHQDAAGRRDDARAPASPVRLAPTRTDKVPNTSATAASSGADLNGGAVKNACEQIRDRLAEVAASGSACPAPTCGSRTAASPASPTPTRRSRGPSWSRRPTSGGSSCGPPGFYRTEGLHWDSKLMHGSPFKYFAYGVAASRGRGRRVHRGLPHPAGRHRPRRRRQPLAAGRHRPDRGRVRPGRRLADPGGPALGRERPAEPRPADHPGGEHLQAAELLGDARGLQRRAAPAGPRGRRRLRVQGGRRAAADARLLGPRGAAAGGGGVRAGRHQRRPGLARRRRRPSTGRSSRRGARPSTVAGGPRRRPDQPDGGPPGDPVGAPPARPDAGRS